MKLRIAESPKKMQKIKRRFKAGGGMIPGSASIIRTSAESLWRRSTRPQMKGEGMRVEDPLLPKESMVRFGFDSDLQARSVSQEPKEAECFRLMAEQSVDVLCRLTIETRCTYCSPSAMRVLGWTSDEMVAHFPQDLVHPDDVSTFKAAHARHMNEDNCENAPATFRVKRKDGSYVWIEINARLVRNPVTKVPWQVLLNMRDVSERKLLEENLEALTLTDCLTSLSNRRAFDLALEREWRRAIRDGTELSLLLLDVDDFKGFNDSYGHQVGDECLRAIAAAAASAARRPGDVAARIGGDEMAVILPVTNAEGATRIAEQLRAAVQALRLPHIRNRKHGSHVTVSVGAATSSTRLGGATSSPEALIQAADRALYKAKQDGRNRVETSLFTMTAA
jgi:diguanylate cyclase (GGDEF)-like protein/PAS domain S-box-containing protein